MTMVRNIKRITVSLASLTALVVAAYFFLPTKLQSGAGVAGEELTVAPRAFSLWVDATGVLRATSVQNFGGPP